LIPTKQEPRRDVSQLSDTSTQIFEPGVIEYYQDRNKWDNMSLATFATHYNVTGKETGMSNLKTFEKWVYKCQKPACLRIPHLTPASGDEYYYSLLVLFKPFQNESEIIHQGMHL